MQKFITKYGLAAHLSLLAVAPLFLFPFFEGESVAKTVFWLSLFAGAWIFLEPSRIGYETLYEARARVFRGVLRDPLFWVGGIVVLYAMLRWLNSGVKMAFDSERLAWYLRSPALESFPGSADGMGLEPFSAAVSVWLAVIGARNALGKSARVACLFFVSFFAGIAALAFALCAFKDVGPVVCEIGAVHAIPSYAGSAFGVAALCGFGAIAGMIERKWNKLLVLYALAAGLSSAGAVMFSLPGAIFVYACAVLLLVLATMAVFLVAGRGRNSLKFLAAAVFAFTVCALAVGFTMPKDSLAALLDSFKSMSFYPEGYSAVRSRLCSVAVESWKSHQWIGTGIGSFPVSARFAATSADWKSWGGILPAGVPCGWVHFACERGLIGLGAIVAVAGFAAFTYFKRAFLSIGRPVFLPMCFAGLIVVVALAIDALNTIPSGAALCIAILAFAVSGNSFPGAKRNSGPSDDNSSGETKNG